ncbi:multidrug transporter, partial [Burkholderia pseudomallei]
MKAMMKPRARRRGARAARRPNGPRAWPLAVAAALVAGCTLAPRHRLSLIPLSEPPG